MKLIATETAYKGNDLYVKEFELVGGVSLRDYFAGVALSNRSFGVRPCDTTKEVAQDCYKMADAMMKERSK